MSEQMKTLKARVQHKHKTESQWNYDVYNNGNPQNGVRSDAFRPLPGELIIYDRDNNYNYERYKIGRQDPNQQSGVGMMLQELDFTKISLTKEDVTDALGYTPPTTNTTYTNASLGQGYGTCATAAATAAKAVTLSGYSLTTGGVVAVKFTYAVPANATMNVNSKGAKSIYYKGSAIVDGVINAGEVATFIYDGTRYHLLMVDRNRFFTSLVPYGTQITASSSAKVDLNTPAYLKVGNYFCSANAQAEFISNLPKAKTAFMMQVYSPLSQTVDNETGAWVYRLRKIIFYTGEEYTQYCYTDGTGGNWKYGEWLQTITSNKTATTTSAGLMSSTDKVKLNGIEDVIDEKIAAAITTTLNTEV